MSLFSKKEKSSIKKVKLLGVRTAEETKVLGTYNSSLYCFLIEREDGTREICEYGANDKNINELLMFIDMD